MKDANLIILNENVPISVPRMIGGHNRYTHGFEYRILPLSFNLQQKGNSHQSRLKSAEYDSIVYVGDDVKGICDVDNKEHKGKVVNFRWNPNISDDGDISFIIILDDETREEVRLIPDTVQFQINPHNVKKHFDLFGLLSKNVNEGNLFDDPTYDDEDIYRMIMKSKFGLPEELCRKLDPCFNGSHCGFTIQKFSLYDFVPLVGYSSHTNSASQLKSMLVNFVSTYKTLRLSNEDISQKFAFNGKALSKCEIPVECWGDFVCLCESILCLHKLTKTRIGSFHREQKKNASGEIVFDNIRCDSEMYKNWLTNFIINNFVPEIYRRTFIK